MDCAIVDNGEMIPFCPTRPFPLVEFSVAEAKAHAREVDTWLGLRPQEIENELLVRGCRRPAPASSGERQELWLGLDVQDLLTPYLELRALLAAVGPQAGQTIVDLGAAYGRMGFVLALHHPDVRFIGYEYVGERIEEARRAIARGGFARLRLEHADLAARDFRPVEADIYFIYDYGTMKAVDKTLHDLKKIAAHRPCRIVARGRHCRGLIQARHPWLENVFERERATIYRASVKDELPFVEREIG